MLPVYTRCRCTGPTHVCYRLRLNSITVTAHFAFTLPDLPFAVSRLRLFWLPAVLRCCAAFGTCRFRWLLPAFVAPRCYVLRVVVTRCYVAFVTRYLLQILITVRYCYLCYILLLHCSVHHYYITLLLLRCYIVVTYVWYIICSVLLMTIDCILLFCILLFCCWVDTFTDYVTLFVIPHVYLLIGVIVGVFVTHLPLCYYLFIHYVTIRLRLTTLLLLIYVPLLMPVVLLLILLMLIHLLMLMFWCSDDDIVVVVIDDLLLLFALLRYALFYYIATLLHLGAHLRTTHLNTARWYFNLLHCVVRLYIPLFELPLLHVTYIVVYVICCVVYLCCCCWKFVDLRYITHLFVMIH